VPAPPSHDWEVIFESPESGVISLVKQAKTIDGLRQCANLIINGLFTRDDDAPIRALYEQSLDDMLPYSSPDTPPLDQGVSRIVQLLREIKMYRQTKHEEHELQRAAGEPVSPEPERRDEGESEPLPGLEVSETLETPVPDNDAQNIDNIFADLFCDRMKQRLGVLNSGIEAATGTGNPVPFILSKDFADHFESLLRQYFIPSFLNDSRALVARAAQQPVDSRRQYLLDQFEGRVSSQNLWDKWQDTWALLVHTKELPDKPEPKKKAGLLGGLKKKKKGPAWMREMTVEEWQVQTKEIKAANKKSKKLWALMVSESDAYLAPEFSDEKLLMDLFARSAKGLQSHINALRQIAEQGTDIGRNLSTYAQGKNIDLPLLAVCFQSPKLFLSDAQGLKKMTIGMDDVDISEAYPMVKHFLSSHF